MLENLHIQVTQDQKLWLEALYRQLKQGKYKNYRALKAELYGKVAADFDPKKIDERLLKYGTDLTVLGIEFIDPEYRILEKSNKVILGIKDILIKQGAPEEISVDEIISLTGIDRPEIDIILKIAFRNFRLYSGLASNANITTTIRIDNDETFDTYLSFESIEKLIENQLKEEEEKQKAPPKVSKGKRVSLTNKFGIPIMQYEDADPEGDPPIQYKPVFTSRITHVNKMRCFVLMPFGEKWSSEVYDSIGRVLSGFGIQVMRADSLHGQIIIEDIWVQINMSAFVIVDVTNQNPNVMYELGIVHTIGKPAILLTQDIGRIPFDFKHHRHYDYENTMGGVKKFQEKLAGGVRAIYETYYPEILLKGT